VSVSGKQDVRINNARTSTEYFSACSKVTRPESQVSRSTTVRIEDGKLYSNLLLFRIHPCSLSGKVIAISGGASGIGLATAKLLISQGAKVSISDIDEKALERATKDIEGCGGHGGEVFAVAADVRSTAQIKAWMSSIHDRFGKLNGAANLAGITGHEPTTTAANIEDSLWERVIGINLTGVMISQREQLQIMEDGGSVVNCASVAGIRGVKGQAAYSASKHGVVGLSKSAAKEMAARRIRVNAVAP
jgi:NAD(P)-dependent dehydrogenase (short-subunit alcohol dehydrogenase family)